MVRRTGLPTMYTTFSRHRLRWLGHVRRMSNEIPKALLNGELVVGKHNVGRPRLRTKTLVRATWRTLISIFKSGKSFQIIKIQFIFFIINLIKLFLKATNGTPLLSKGCMQARGKKEDGKRKQKNYFLFVDLFVCFLYLTFVCVSVCLSTAVLWARHAWPSSYASGQRAINIIFK